MKETSSPYFCILAAVFSSEFSADACDREIEELRRSLGKKSDYEFHFSKCPESIRQRFLNRVARLDFVYHAFVMDKRRLFGDKFTNGKAFYEFAVSIVCQNAGPLLRDAKVVIDRTGDREFLYRLQKTLKSQLNLPEGSAIRKVVMQDSHKNNLLQLADMTCGAVARSITAKDNRWRDILRAGKRESRVQCWPK